MPKLNAIDQSWGRISPKAAKANGILVVYGYMSHDSSKNLSSPEIKAYHQAGIGVWLGWESNTGRPLLGASAGTEDAHDSLLQLSAHYANLGYKPKNNISVPFSCDTDINSSQLPTILKYYKAAQTRLGKNIYAGAYGEADLINYLYKNGIQHGLFQTYAWSNGVVSPHADLYQYQNNMILGGASVDYDSILNAIKLGAWWPPGSKYDVGEDEVTKDDIDAIAAAVWSAKLTNSHMGDKGVTAAASTYLTNSDRFAQQSALNTANLDPAALEAAFAKQSITISQAQIKTAMVEVLNSAKIQVN